MIYSLFSGRRPIIGKTPMTSALCAALHCGFPMVEAFPHHKDQTNGEAYVGRRRGGRGATAPSPSPVLSEGPLPPPPPSPPPPNDQPA